MKNNKVKKIALFSLAIIVMTMLSVGAITMDSNKNPSNAILDLFIQKKSDNPSATNDFKNMGTFASVNGIPIPKNIIALKKALYESVVENSKNSGGSLSDALAIDSCPSEEEIVQDIAKRLLFVEYAKEQGIIVEEAEVIARFAEIDERHKQRLRENNLDAILKEQFDKEFLTAIGLSQEEFKEYMLKEQIVYSLYCEQYAIVLSNDAEANNWKGFDSFCNDLLLQAEIVYYK